MEISETMQNDYEIPFSIRKVLTPEQCSDIVNSFKNHKKEKYDSDGLRQAQMELALKEMGHDEVTSDQIEQMCNKCQDGVVRWHDFIEIVKDIKLQGQKRKSAAVSIRGVGAGEKVKGEGDSGSVYLREEVSVLTRWINNSLADEPTMVGRIPIDPDNDDLFNTCSDGLVLIHLLNMIDPNLIDMNKVAKGENLNVFQVRLNLDLALEGCKKIIKVVGIDA